MINSWGYLCSSCRHLMSNHHLAEGGDLKDGPYRCQTCSCAVAQDAPCTGISEAEYRRQEGAS